MKNSFFDTPSPKSGVSLILINFQSSWTVYTNFMKNVIDSEGNIELETFPQIFVSNSLFRFVF